MYLHDIKCFPGWQEKFSADRHVPAVAPILVIFGFGCQEGLAFSQPVSQHRSSIDPAHYPRINRGVL